MNKTCPCGNIFFVKSYLLERKKYCCKKCFYKYRIIDNTGKKYVIKNINPTWIKKGNKPWNYGLAGKGICKATSGSIKKGEHISRKTEFKKLDKPWNKGIVYEAILWDKHFNFKTGHSRYKQFAIRMGKKPICEECGLDGEFGTKMHVHHVDHNRKNNIITNLKILCSKCHVNHHKNWEKRKFVL